MARRKLIYTGKKISKRGRMSAFLGVLSLAGLAVSIYAAYKKDGEISMKYGVTGFLAMIFSLSGLILGTCSLRDDENFRFLPVLGIVLNSLSLICVGIILYIAI
ncbi:MAG: DUF6142 family protein [Lachnospiraceae bacterium]|nr:DUF6142 family protein [Lachnospiraceae bacterium]